MQKPFHEIEREADRIRAEFIRELAGLFGQFVKRNFDRFTSLLSLSSRAEAK